MKNNILFWFGLYIFVDGMISLYWFSETALLIEQAMRLVRCAVGLYFIWSAQKNLGD